MMKFFNRKFTSVALVCLFTWLNVAQADNAQEKTNHKLGGNFYLTDHDNQAFELHQLKGNVVLIFFGYTSCPDVCPAELGLMAQVLNTFEDKGEKVKGLFISVDPDRDSPQVLKDYTAYFSQQLRGLTGSREAINKVTELFRVNYQITKNAENRIVVDHSSTLYIIDKKGDVNTMVPYGMGLTHIESVIKRLLEN